MSRVLGFPIIPNLKDSHELLGETPISVYQSLLERVDPKHQNSLDKLEEIKAEQEAVSQNQFREILTSLLRSKDDNIVLMITSLISAIIDNEHISMDVLRFCGLLTFSRDP